MIRATGAGGWPWAVVVGLCARAFAAVYKQGNVAPTGGHHSWQLMDCVSGCEMVGCQCLGARL